MSFIQIIEYETNRPEELLALDRQIEESSIPSRVTHMQLTKDRDNPNGYVTIVEFPSYEEAMANSNSPDVQQFANRMTELCTGPPTFHNLDVMRNLP